MKHDSVDEQYVPDDTHPIDAVGWRAFEAFSQRTSRRGFLSKAARLCFVALGVGITEELLPVHRANAAPRACSDPSMCGFCGSQCGCGTCSGSPNKCPNCACVGSFWHACCGGVNWRYKDCFKGTCTSTKFNNCANCQPCCNSQYPGTGPYPGAAGCTQYMCTIVYKHGSC
jgi:hypothetical protein